MARSNRTNTDQKPATSTTPKDVVDYAEDLRGIVQAAIDYIDSEISPSREKGWRYFNGEVEFTPEDKSRSQIVQTEVRDTVEQAMPVAMDLLLRTGEVVAYEAAGIGQEQIADLETEFCNYLFMEENNGEVLLHDGLKSCFTVKNCCYRVAWRDQSLHEEYTLKLAEPELQAIAADEEIELETVSEPDKHGIVTATIKRSRVKGRLDVLGVKMETVFFDREADSVENARVVGIRGELRVSDVLAMGLGLSLDDVLQYVGPGELEGAAQQEAQARQQTGQNTYDAPVPDEDTAPGSQQIEVIEAWIRFDGNKDGTEELLYVVMLGSGRSVVHTASAPWVPLVIGSTLRVPHQIAGTSYADLTVDLQDWTTGLSRGLADNAALVNNPRKAIVTDDVVSIAAIEANIFNGWIPVRSPDAITEFATPFVGDKLMMVLEYAEQRREARTGISRRSLGLDPDAMRSMSEIYVAAVVGAPTKQLGLAVRMFAATAIAPLFRLILNTAKLNAPALGPVRIGGQLRRIDPRIFPTDMPIKVKVGLGIEAPEVKLQGLLTIAAKQEAAMGTMGPDNPLCSVPQLAHTLTEVVKTLGHESPELFFNPPPAAAQKLEEQKQQQPPGDPVANAKAKAIEQKAMTDQQKAAQQMQLAAQKAQQDAQAAMMKAQTDQQKARAQLMLDHAELQMKAANAAAEREQEFVLRMMEMQTEAQLDSQAQKLDAAVDLKVGMETAKHQGDAAKIKAKAAGNGRTQLRRPN